MHVLLPEDPEGAVLAELDAQLPARGFPSVTLAAKTLGTKLTLVKPRPDLFARVLASGGLDRDLVTDSPTIILEGYGTQEKAARDLCALMLGIITAAARDGAVGGVTCYRSRVFSLPANLPHPNLPDRFRYTATVSLDLRKASL